MCGGWLMELLSALRPAVVTTLPVSAVKGDTVVLNSNGHLYTYDGVTWVDNAATSGVTIHTTEVLLRSGNLAKKSGSFTLTNASITPLSVLMITLAPGPYTGKGSLADEAQMYPGITFAAVPGSGSALVQWACSAVAKGNVKINYIIG